MFEVPKGMSLNDTIDVSALSMFRCSRYVITRNFFLDKIYHMIAQNLHLDELYHAEASNLTFRDKRLAYAQSHDMVYITPFYRMEAGSLRMVYVNFHKPIFPRDFYMTICYF